MTSDIKTNSTRNHLIILIGTAVFVQLIGRYYSVPFLIGGYFDLWKIICILILPLCVARFYFKFSMKDLGLGRPKISRKEILYLLVFLIGVPLVISAVQMSPLYLRYYQEFRNPGVDLSIRWRNFALFTISTIFAWEFLHRGFLLFGIKKLLRPLQIDETLISSLAILWVMTFEVSYHFIKPDLEAWGMLALSPFLSWLAIKTKSLWIPLGLHLLIEGVFFFFITST
jgi:membrane protease YdiL (CAAX protease family)